MLRIPVCPDILSGIVIISLTFLVFSLIFRRFLWISLELSSLDLLLSCWYGVFILFIKISRSECLKLIDRITRIGLEIIEDSVFFFNHREKIELVCHQWLLSSGFLLPGPFLQDINCMFLQRSSAGGDSTSCNTGYC